MWPENHPPKVLCKILAKQAPFVNMDVYWHHIIPGCSRVSSWNYAGIHIIFIRHFSDIFNFFMLKLSYEIKQKHVIHTLVLTEW